jgi:hypothetical protein
MRQIMAFNRAIIASFAVVLLLISGCGEQQPKAPLDSNPEATESATGLSKKRITASTSTSSDTRVARYNILNFGLMLVEDLSTSQLVKASTGGTLYLGEFKFYVPPGSLANDTVIGITMTSDKYIQMDFSPNGTQFNPPAIMTATYATADLKNISASKLSISWLDTGTNQWINLGGTVDQSKWTVSVPITHFTEYSLSTR